ncbi:MAG: lipoprotein insertase outer membrane protein LolB [Pseudomonadales bacterium]
MRKILALSLCSLLLSGCSMFQSKPEPAPQPTISWQEHFNQVNALDDWRASGKVSITLDKRVQSAKLVWQQQEDKFHIAFIGPLGQSGPVLKGDEGSASLTIPKEPEIKGPNTSSLLQQRLGWQLPVESARFWIKGIPSPLSESEILLEQEKLSSLKQDGWDITYDRYLRSGDVELPAKITLTRPELKLKFAIYNWELTP